MNETELIERYFVGRGARRADVLLGIGDDAAIVRVPRDQDLVLTTDSLIEGIHFRRSAPPRSIGHRALAVNLSDIAAMGAEPAWMLLSLVLPRLDQRWLSDFSRALAALARRAGVALTGGNLSRGALAVTIELAGLLPRGVALRRDGGSPGHELYVSGTLGDAAGGRRLLTRAGAAVDRAGVGTAARALRRRFEYPQPRLALGRALRGIASACIDVSDGLCIDAQRLLRASGCSAELEVDRLPLSRPLRRLFGARAVRLALAGGEDYELCFAAAPRHAATVQAISQRLGVPLTRIGSLRRGAGLQLRSHDRKSVTQFSDEGFDPGFDHFAPAPGVRTRRRAHEQ